MTYRMNSIKVFKITLNTAKNETSAYLSVSKKTLKCTLENE